MVHRREVEGQELVLGNQGDLYGRAMTWWDHDTGSVWSQPRGEAILGPRTGQRLDLLPSSLTAWSTWQENHPETLALDVHAWSTAFRLEDMVIVVDLGTEAAAYDLQAVQAVGVVNDQLAGIDIAVAVDPTDISRWAVFDRTVEGQPIELAWQEGGLVDTESGTMFDSVLGTSSPTSSADPSLARLPAFTSFPNDFFTFFPDGTIWD